MQCCRGRYKDLNALRPSARGIEVLVMSETPVYNFFSISAFLLIRPCYVTFTCVLIIFIIKIGETESLEELAVDEHIFQITG